jgi:hypothetical protein
MRPEAFEAADSAWPATIAAAVLRRGSMIHVASLVLTSATLLGYAATSMFGIGRNMAWLSIVGAIVVMGIVEFYLAARVVLDADLFDAIAANAADLAGFDRAMSALRLRRADKTTRILAERIRAAFRLLKLQAAALALQVVVLAATVVCVQGG